MICPSCGNEVKDGNRFCNMCGSSLEVVAPAPVSAAPVTEVVETPAPVAPAPIAPAPVAPTPVAPTPVQVQVQVPAPVAPVAPAPAPVPAYCPPYVPAPAAPVAPMMVTAAKSKKHFNIFSMIATVALILAVFVLPFERAMMSSKEPTMFSELTTLFGYIDYLTGLGIVNLILLTVVPLTALVLGIIGSFTNKRALPLIGGILLVLLIVWILYNGFRFDFEYVFELERAGFYTLFGSGVLYIVGGTSGV